MTTPYQPPSFANVSFNPLGVDTIEQHFSQNPLFKRQAKALAFAYFITGSHNDGSHKFENKHHPVYRTFRSGYTQENQKDYSRTRREYMWFVLDALTAWDRITGGATVMVHTNGTRRPGAPNVLTESSIDAYAPPHLIDELPNSAYAFARIVQEFAQGIALDTTERWDKLSNKKSWSTDGPAPDPITPSPALLPRSLSTHFLFHGRPWGTLEPLIEQYVLTRSAVVQWSVYAPPPKLPMPSIPPQPSNASTPTFSLPVPPGLNPVRSLLSAPPSSARALSPTPVLPAHPPAGARGDVAVIASDQEDSHYSQSSGGLNDEEQLLLILGELDDERHANKFLKQTVEEHKQNLDAYHTEIVDQRREIREQRRLIVEYLQEIDNLKATNSHLTSRTSSFPDVVIVTNNIVIQSWLR
ncbi:hypothetical protein GY45DRAFT_1376569 [Cubamyces sp. BRFM 1775]|nr:hypothetical protein GY45DRAFT_1376569 [Cubamyces sp. BRFM 1775]